jgi:hypothetical protein
MSVQDPLFWRHLHEPEGERDVSIDGAVALHRGDPSLQRVSATLLLTVSVWSRAAPVPHGSSALGPGASSSSLMAPFGHEHCESEQDMSQTTMSARHPGITPQGSPVPTGHGQHSGNTHLVVPGALPASRQPLSVRVGTPQSQFQLAASAQNDAVPDFFCDPDEYPRHGEALRRARQRLRSQRHFRDPFAGPTPHEFSSVSPTYRGRLSTRHVDPTLRTPGSPLINQHLTTSVDDYGMRREESEPGRPCDLTSQRLVQDVLMFARGTGMRKLQNKQINGCNATLSLGHVGAVYIDIDGKPGELGVAHLPPPARLGWRRYVKCACLDSGVALLTETRGEVFFTGTYREHTPTPPKGRSSGATTSAPTSASPSPAHDVSAIETPTAAAVLKMVANNVVDISASRARLGVLRHDGSIQLISPCAIRLTGAGIQPFSNARHLVLGQSQDVFYIDDSTQLLGKCSASPRIATTPRQVTTMLGRAVYTVAAGYNFVIAIDTRGGVWAQGRNEKGQLGVGSNEETLRPFTPDQTLRGRHYVTGVSCGRQHAVAVTSSGAVFVAGDNKYGQLGLTPEETEAAAHKAPNTVNRFTRLQLPGTCVGVACGTFSTFFVMKDGTVLGTGNNDFGQLGIMPPSSVVSPPQAVEPIALRGGLLGHSGRTGEADHGKKVPGAGKTVCCCSDGCIVA